MKIGIFIPDGWSFLHFMMGMGAALIVRSLGGDRWTAFGAGVLVCTAWELLDGLFAGKLWFDPRGADLIDVLVGAVGAGITILAT